LVQIAFTILLLPLAAFVLIVFVTRKHQPLSAGVGIVAMAAATILSWFVILPAVIAGQTASFDFNWLRLWPDGVPASTQQFLSLGIQVDPLAAIMLVVVTTVSFLVQIYSRSYMIEHGHRDPGYSRFFAYLSLFTFSMLVVVLADNLLFLFIGWELVGLSSYLLIGFWFDRTARRGVHLLPPWVAAKKAFLTTRVGDVGFLIGLIILWNVGGTLKLTDLFDQVEHNTGHLLDSGLLLQPILFWACLGLFAGAVGKSGQFPLHVWLPDAMEGPTPVSALIHAATMVAAGVYLIARTFPLFEHVPQALTVVAIIGGFTAIFAASMGLASNDIKRILAYSTVSQLGYMMLALGAGSLAAGMFHLFTHAFFKALLFLCAGSVIHAVGTNDISEMGGLRRYMPKTYWTMLIGALSLSGFIGFSGFWSKDDVIVAAANTNPILLLFALITVFLTAFYTFRMFILTFHGQFRGPVAAAVEESGHHPATVDAETHEGGLHEADWWMTLPLILLAIPAMLIGFVGSPFMGYAFQRFLEGPSFQGEAPNYFYMGLSIVLSLAGIGGAILMYAGKAYVTEPLTRLGSIYTLLARRYYIDELYMRLIDIFVIGVGAVLAIFDRQALDNAFNSIADLFANTGRWLRGAQTGRVQTYGLVLFGGMAVIALALMFGPLLSPLVKK
jgi:NADH-quinone oxidoreductase subunit L